MSEVQCNRCRFWELASVPEEDMMESLRKEGWSFGEMTLCPACNGSFHEMMKEGSE